MKIIDLRNIFVDRFLFVEMGALSAIDIGLWDIAGKHHGVPIYELLGGPYRHKARVYHHLIPTDPGIGMELAEGVAERFPYRFRGIETMLAEDGSVVDQ
jgi:L-alanine-DL-glutamate epimerase-like enolase superfamily enzyme